MYSNNEQGYSMYIYYYIKYIYIYGGAQRLTRTMTTEIVIHPAGNSKCDDKYEE